MVIILILHCTAENVIIYVVELIILNQIKPPPLLNSRCGSFSNSHFHMKPLILPICTSQIAPPMGYKEKNSILCTLSLMLPDSHSLKVCSSCESKSVNPLAQILNKIILLEFQWARSSCGHLEIPPLGSPANCKPGVIYTSAPCSWMHRPAGSCRTHRFNNNFRNVEKSLRQQEQI